MTREEAIRHLEAAKLMLLGNDNQPISDLYYALDMSIEALKAEPKTGHWIEKSFIVNGKINGAQIQCSECLSEIRCPQYRYEHLYEYEKYCSSCGAKMVEPQESEDKE